MSSLKCGPTDIDLATDATPSQMRKVAEAMHVRVIPTGEDYGTLTFRLNRRNYEITTFRKDLKTDGRRASVASLVLALRKTLCVATLQ